MLESMLAGTHISLETHPKARSKCVATAPRAAGTVLLVVPALSTALLQAGKGRRCDNCHRLESDIMRLRKCTGCVSYWYCGRECQSLQWTTHHKRICKHYPRYTASTEYQALSSHDQVDAVLLSHMLAEAFPDGLYTWTAGKDGPLDMFLDLLRGPATHPLSLPVSLGQPVTDPALLTAAKEFYERFGNNNFVIHSHLDSYAHGVFPLASRLFNHSCVPNAVTRYIISPSEAVRMEVIALRDIAEGEEVTIPYLDPALPVETRRQALRLNYGFTCACASCRIAQRIRPTPPPGRGSTELDELEIQLRRYVLGNVGTVVGLRDDPGLLESMPESLAPVLHESYLPELSETFSRASHDGPHAEALSTGLTLLALYILVYPANYPQIGMHALELAKTAWNATVTDSESSSLEGAAKTHLYIAAQVLNVYGEEGDEGGPLAEIAVLQTML